MRRSAFLPLRRLSKTSALMLPGKQIDRERNFRSVSKFHPMPCSTSPSMLVMRTPSQLSRADSHASHLVPTPRSSGSRRTAASCSAHQRPHFDDWLQCDVGATLRLRGVDDVGVAAGDGAHLARIWAGEDAGGHRGIGKPERAGREKRAAARRMDHQLQRASSQRVFFACDLLRIDKLPCGRDQWRRLQDLRRSSLCGNSSRIFCCVRPSSHSVQRLRHIFDQVFDRLAAGAHADESFGNRVAAPSSRDVRLLLSRRRSWSLRSQLRLRKKGFGGGFVAQDEAQHRPEVAHLLLGDLVAGMRRQPGIQHADDFIRVS